MAYTTHTIGQSAYNPFNRFSKLSYNCISHLIENNELIWKLLKHTENDAWDYANLTREEKASLIYNGQQDSSMYNVFMDAQPPDVFTNEVTLLRITPYFAAGKNRTVGYIEMSMEIYSHYKINHLTNYQTRVDTIAEELLTLFNGADVGGLGLLAFNTMDDNSSRLISTGQIPFGGKQLIFSTDVA